MTFLFCFAELVIQGVHPKTVHETLGHSTISTTLDTYSHVAPGLQQAAAGAFDDIFTKDSTLDKQLAGIIHSRISAKLVPFNDNALCHDSV